MIKLYGMGQSRSFRCLWALEEAGLPYDYVPVNTRAKDSEASSTRHPEYLALNVQGKVPTLVNGELVLTESAAILNYIGRLAPESGLLPRACMDVYAKLEELEFFILTELEQPLWSKGKHWFALPKEQRVPEMLETAKFEFAKAVNCLPQLLPEGDFAIADQFTVVDILLAQTFNWALRFEFEVPQLYIDLRDRHYGRPAARRALSVVE